AGLFCPMKFLLPILLLASVSCTAQSADFLVLKKKNKTIQTFYSGNNISITTQSGAYISALINGIKEDTLYLQEFITRYMLTTFGTYIIDTLGSYRYKFHYNQIRAIGRKQKTNFNWRGSGASLMGGGSLIVIGSGIVYLADKQKFSLPLLLAGAGLGTLGYFMAKGKKGGDGFLIGKKYQLVYMNMSNQKTNG
ncbi:MAG TPA: hypothetical protein PLY26_13735, partial [Ferruginibacter sp.]|nr:hypothetical protein [Ferruginibacter sp.]